MDNSPAAIIASSFVIKSGEHTHYAGEHAGVTYFSCSTVQKSRKFTMQPGVAVTCSKCIKRRAQLEAWAAQGLG